MNPARINEFPNFPLPKYIKPVDVTKDMWNIYRE